MNIIPIKRNATDYEQYEPKSVPHKTGIELTSVNVFGKDVGSLKAIELPNSGVTCILSKPTAIEIEKLILALADVKQDIGYRTVGLVTSASDMYIHKSMYEFTKEFITNSKGNMDKIMLPDLLFLFGNFVSQLRETIDLESKCNCGIVSTNTVDIKSLLLTKKFDFYQISHFSKTEGELTNKDVDAYIRRYNDDKILYIDNYEIHLSVPTISRYFSYSEIWIDFIEKNLEEFPNGESMLKKLIRSSILGVYLHYITKVVDANGNFITDPNVLLELIASKGTDNNFVSETISGITKYISDTSLSNVQYDKVCECGITASVPLDIVSMGLDIMLKYMREETELLAVDPLV